MKHRVFLLFTFYFLFVSCHQEQTSVSPEEQAREDSLALHVAVVPVMDCLPIYYADHIGMFAQAGLSIRLQEHLSQMDSETALRNGDAEVAYTDIARILELQGDSATFRIIMGMRGRTSLVAARSKRIRSLKHLKERMVALDRLSAADYWSDKVMQKAGLDQADIYRPQINDLRLRTSMLKEALVDAALLPEPYATQAERAGNPRLFTSNDSVRLFTGMAIAVCSLRDSMRTAQISRFVRVYNMAVEEINQRPDTKALQTILHQAYALPTEIADSVKIPVYAKATLPSDKDADLVQQWLYQRERKIRQSARDSLFYRQFLPESQGQQVPCTTSRHSSN